mmetsp:Transcript_34463/g.63346  ORF Transcript_34463/g.63346 Transcript_34463/m.63346 type:complete len:277 (+) Transcript_34463:96-926(+)
MERRIRNPRRHASQTISTRQRRRQQQSMRLRRSQRNRRSHRRGGLLRSRVRRVVHALDASGTVPIERLYRLRQGYGRVPRGRIRFGVHRIESSYRRGHGGLRRCYLRGGIRVGNSTRRHRRGGPGRWRRLRLGRVHPRKWLRGTPQLGREVRRDDDEMERGRFPQRGAGRQAARRVERQGVRHRRRGQGGRRGRTRKRTGRAGSAQHRTGFGGGARSDRGRARGHGGVEELGGHARAAFQVCGERVGGGGRGGGVRFRVRGAGGVRERVRVLSHYG